MNTNRRTTPERRSPHELSVHAVDGGLETRCACGKQVGGNRYEDRVTMSLGDLLELVRLHSNEVNYPKG